jgi:hypothetical protein
MAKSMTNIVVSHKDHPTTRLMKDYMQQQGILPPSRTQEGRLTDQMINYVDKLSHSDVPAISSAIGIRGVLRTAAHDGLYSYVLNRAANLGSRNSIFKGTAASWSFVGPKGIGKSASLRALARTLPLMWPNVIAVYVNYGGVSTDANLLHFSLLEMVAKATEDVLHLGPGRPTPLDVRKALEAAGLSMLLIVDELDKLYEVPLYIAPVTPMRTFGQLAALGDDNAGRIATCLVGSSSFLPDLITANAKIDDEARCLYPQVRVAPDLNGQKYRTFRLHYNTPMDLAAVADVLGVVKPDTPQSTVNDVATLRSYAFVCGATLRNVIRLAGALSEVGGELNAQIINTFSATASVQPKHTLSRQRCAADFNRALQKALYDKNRALLSSLLTDTGTISGAAVQSVAWEQMFQPLIGPEVERIARVLGIDNWWHYLNYLFDRDYICLELLQSFDDGGLHVYPYTLLELLKSQMSQTRSTAADMTMADQVARVSLHVTLGNAVRKAGVREVAHELLSAAKASHSM